ncbi:MAG: DUF192 domain-containing protein [Ignavibacteriaceae bacterium]|nr:DUF192 domain-containing protein [Ignavibacteriaceae bacterium]
MSKINKQRNKITKNPTPNKRNLFIGIVTVVLIGAFFILYVIQPTGEEEIVTEYFFKKEGELVITDSMGVEKIKIDIEIADTYYERSLGLMLRSKMELNQGMLFIFPVEEMQSFWMRNTRISLDIMFINSKFEIINIHRNTRTMSDQSYPSEKPAQFVLETIAGFSDIYKIEPGDRVNWVRTQ